jgi:hypothetical protein
MHPEEGVEAAVTTRQLHGHEPGRYVTHPRAIVALYSGARDVQLGYFRDQLERELGLVPVFVDYGYDLRSAKARTLSRISRSSSVKSSSRR